jgi:hypothetical protein
MRANMTLRSLNQHRESSKAQGILGFTISKRSSFCGALLVSFDLFELGDFDTNVVPKLPVHCWFVAKLEKNF